MERLMTGNKNYKPGQLVTINNHVYKICNCFHMSKKQYEERNGLGQLITFHGHVYRIIKLTESEKNNVFVGCGKCNLYKYCYCTEKFLKYCSIENTSNFHRDAYLKFVK